MNRVNYTHALRETIQAAAHQQNSMLLRGLKSKNMVIEMLTNQTKQIAFEANEAADPNTNVIDHFAMLTKKALDKYHPEQLPQALLQLESDLFQASMKEAS